MLPLSINTTLQWKSTTWNENFCGLTGAEIAREWNLRTSYSKGVAACAQHLTLTQRSFLRDLPTAFPIAHLVLLGLLQSRSFSGSSLFLKARILRSFCVLSEGVEESALRRDAELLYVVIDSKAFSALILRRKEMVLNLFDVADHSFKEALAIFFQNLPFSCGMSLNAVGRKGGDLFKELLFSLQRSQKRRLYSCWIDLSPLLLRHIAEIVRSPSAESRKRKSITLLIRVFLTTLEEHMDFSRN